MRVLVADDNAVVRMGMVALLEGLDDVSAVVTAADGEAAATAVEAGEVDFAFLDVRMPILDGLGALARIAGVVPCVMLTHSEEAEVIREALHRGARGYLVHGHFEREELRAALQVASTGALLLGDRAVSVLSHPVGGRTGPPEQLAARLTDRERTIMDIVAEGVSNADVAGRLYLSEKTVKNHLNRMYVKLRVTSRAQAISAWLGGAPGPAAMGPPKGS